MAIPKGTLLSIVISTIVYIFFIFVCGATVLREASGNITDVNMDAIFSISTNCSEVPCDWGLQNSFQVMAEKQEFRMEWNLLNQLID